MADTTPTRIKIGDLVSYAEFGQPHTYRVTAIEDAGLRVRLDDGLGDLGYRVSTDLITLIEAAPAPVVDEPTPVAPAPTPAARPLLVKRTLAPRTSRRMSPTAANVIADLGCSALVGRGRGAEKLDVRQILALHDRGYLIARISQATGRVVGAIVTARGVRRALEIIHQATTPALGVA